MKPLRAFYSPDYAAPDNAPSARLRLLAERLQHCPLVDVHAPSPLDTRLLHGLHSEEYTQSFLHGTAPLASSQGVVWSPAIRDSVLAMLAGQLEAADHALQHGIAMNVARGFHHAVWSRGGGLCALNGLALVAHCRPDLRVFVLDCDEHGGNGTEEFCSRLDNLYNASIFGTRFGCYGSTRSWAFPVNVSRDGFASYLDALQAARALVVEHAPDLLIYQAGVDCHRDDPKGQAGLSTRHLLQRDRWVFRMAQELRIAVLFVVAGGYQDARTLTTLNGNTVRAAINAYRCAAASR